MKKYKNYKINLLFKKEIDTNKLELISFDSLEIEKLRLKIL